MFNSFYSPISPEYQTTNNHALLLNSAINRFNQARQSATFEQIKCFILRRFSGLRDLAALPHQQVRTRRYGGLRSVSLEKICGTLGRANDFDHLFQPRRDSTRDRWVSVAIARSQYIPLEPVKLIQVSECYFVEDGHHRISVARALGETFIEAEVTVWDICCALPWEKTPSATAIPQIA
ncbi:hypothetical protein [Candidatus Chloroploca sp. Khr17]|uniref:hypothetical protein n=1 Tax=Candidatus Chloroploca sp. Khr17 TaxID=2496869 RepID=UPI00101D3249|nr:hypothetical protein [Candidatus Chloroploca sp. Khr17]